MRKNQRTFCLGVVLCLLMLVGVGVNADSKGFPVIAQIDGGNYLDYGYQGYQSEGMPTDEVTITGPNGLVPTWVDEYGQEQPYGSGEYGQEQYYGSDEYNTASEMYSGDSADAPISISLSPASGALNTLTDYTFTCTYSDSSGYADITSCYLLINTNLTGENAVYLYYDVRFNRLWLRDNANFVWLGGYTPGSPYTIENSQCTIDCSQTTVTGSGGSLSVQWHISFKSAMSGKVCPAYMTVYGCEDMNDSWKALGSFTIDLDDSDSISSFDNNKSFPTDSPLYSMGESLNSPPQNISLTPNTGNFTPGTQQTLTALYRDPDGYADIKYGVLIVDNVVDGINCLYVKYVASENKLYLKNEMLSG